MIKVTIQHIALYIVGVFLLIFGSSDFWERFQRDKSLLHEKKKARAEAMLESNRPFEVQRLRYDTLRQVWKNNAVTFQRYHVKPDFNATPVMGTFTKLETNDDEHASDSF